jgi:hypothetical protein
MVNPAEMLYLQHRAEKVLNKVDKAVGNIKEMVIALSEQGRALEDIVRRVQIAPQFALKCVNRSYVMKVWADYQNGRDKA